MTDTAIRATFSDCRTVKTRKVFQLILELPIEQANAALAALGGVPQFGEEQWVGVAPITHEAASQPAPRKEMTRSQWAGMLCQDRLFLEFLAETYKQGGGITSVSVGTAGDMVRAICGVESRSMLDSVRSGAAKWDTLRTEYDAWRGRIASPDRGLG